MAKTTIYIPDKLLEKARETNINISRICRKAIEAELHKDDPLYIQQRIDLINKEKERLNKEHSKLAAELDYSKQLQERRETIRKQISPDINDFRTIIPKNDGGEKNSIHS